MPLTTVDADMLPVLDSTSAHPARAASFDDASAISPTAAVEVVARPVRCAWPVHIDLESLRPLSLSPSWLVHQYVFGALFSLIALHALVAVLRLWRRRHLLSRRWFALLTLGVGASAGSRAVHLLLDATLNGYRDWLCAASLLSAAPSSSSPPTVSPSTRPLQSQRLVALAVYLLSKLVFPLLVSVVTALVAAMIRSSGIVLPRDSCAVARAVPCFVSLFLSLALVALPTAFLSPVARPVLYVYHVFAAFWGLFLWIAYVALFRTMSERAYVRQLAASRALSKNMGLSSKHAAKRQRLTLLLAVRGTMCVVCCLLVLCALETYRLIGAPLAEPQPPPQRPDDRDAASGGWQWWAAAETGTRLAEVAVCLSLTYVAVLPFRGAAPSPAVGDLSSGATPAGPGSGGGGGGGSGSGGNRRRRALSGTSSVQRQCRDAFWFYCSPCSQQCGSDDNEYLISVAEWTEAREDDYGDEGALGLHQVKRQESTKSDLYPLHLITRNGEVGSTPTTPAGRQQLRHSAHGGGGAAMLSAERGKLSWRTDALSAAAAAEVEDRGRNGGGGAVGGSGDHAAEASDGCASSDISCCENPHYYHSATDISQQPTLKVERDLADAYAELQSRNPAAVAAAAAAAEIAAAASADGSQKLAPAVVARGSSPAIGDSPGSTARMRNFAGAVERKPLEIPEVVVQLQPPSVDGDEPAPTAELAASASGVVVVGSESPNLVLQRSVLRRASPGRVRNTAEARRLLAVGRCRADDGVDDIDEYDSADDDDDDISELSVHVDEGQVTGELEAHV